MGGVAGEGVGGGVGVVSSPQYGALPTYPPGQGLSDAHIPMMQIKMNAFAIIWRKILRSEVI